jgi:2-hydroxy-6-oxonona-2,4-dienedioate hydrolase
VGERDLAGSGNSAAADESGMNNRMVRRAEGTAGEESGALWEEAGDGVELGDLEPSGKVSGGRMVARRRASIVFPDPGGPTRRTARYRDLRLELYSRGPWVCFPFRWGRTSSMREQCLNAQTALATLAGRRVWGRILRPAQTGADAFSLPRPLLLLHGLGCSSDAWLPSFACLERARLDQPVISPDFPGYGRSPGPPDALGIDELADWMAQLLEALGLPCVDVAGNSMGCQVALALARRHPERVGALVLAGPTTGRRLMPLWRYAAGLANTFREPLSYKPTALRLFREMGFRRYVATVRRMLEDDPLIDIEAIKVPCLVVCGEWDAIIPAAVAKALPNGRFVRIPRAGHVVPSYQPEALTATLLDFLAAQRHADTSPMRPDRATGTSIT